MKVDFERLQWENYPSTNTPLNADNLNRLEEGVAGLYSDVSEIQEELGGGVGEYVTDWLDEHVTPGGSTIVVDDTLTIQGAAADAKKTGDEISDLKDGFDDLDDRVTALEQGTGSGLTEDIKQALLQIAEKVAYIDEDGQDYYDALEDALYPPAPPATLVSITAVYTQSGTVYDTTTLDDLKSDLVVTATYDDSTTATVTTYTLSGTLAVGTSTITVTYEGKTDTFDVIVSHGQSDMDHWFDGVAYTDIDVIENSYYVRDSVDAQSYNGWSRTGYVFCQGASTITFPALPQIYGGSIENCMWVSENNTFVSRLALSKTDTVTLSVPSSAKYFALSSQSSAIASILSGDIVPHA